MTISRLRTRQAEDAVGRPFEAVQDGLERPSYIACLVAAIIVTGWSAQIAWGQASTVQLPTYRTFRSNSAVLVPDRGNAYLGGVNRARSGRNEFGTPLLPFRNRAIGSELSASGTSVSVYIHDFAAMEDELQRAAAGSARVVAGDGRAVAGSPDPTTRPTEGLQQRNGDLRSTASAGSGAPPQTPLPSIEKIRRQRRLDEEARESEGRDFFERGQAAEESGKQNVARIYYQMAAKRASGSFKDEVLARLDSIRRQQTPRLAHQEEF
jgi:hypothetical protein